MQTTIEKGASVLATGNSNGIINPPVYTAERSGDGEGDGRLIEEGINKAEAYANNSASVELGGINLAETVYLAAHRTILRNKLSNPTGRLVVSREMPTFLS